MKSKFLTCCLAMVIVTASSTFADPKPAVTSENVIEKYIASYINSDFKALNKILSDDACTKIPRAGSVIVHKKDLVIKDMKLNGFKHNCAAKYEIITKSDGVVIARVDFEQDIFKQQNFITLEKDGKDWKITQIYRVYPSDQQNNYLPANTTAQAK